MRILLCMTACAAAACVVSGQTAGAPPRFDAADVHASSQTGPASQFARGPFLSGARYDFRGATIVDLIARAYDVTPDKVIDGPNWLEYDRFDISAAVPAKTSAAEAKLMLRTLLADRFGLEMRNESRPLPAYVLTAPKGKKQLKEAEGTGDTACRFTLDQARPAEPLPADGPPGLPAPLTVSYTCRNTTMAAFAESLRTLPLAQQFIGTNPVQDKFS